MSPKGTMEVHEERHLDLTPPVEAIPVIEPGHTYGSVTDKISSIVLTRGTPLWWIVTFLFWFGLLQMFMAVVTWLLAKGVGVWGINMPVAWGFAIINFVWWIGIGHAGTLISAILALLKQTWRNSINRFAEAMTLFAVMCAGMFPVLHTGRPWLAYWLFPYPNSMAIWPQFRSPLVWDVFAVSTYATVSALFWYVGLIPDLATMRDTARSKPVKMLYGIFALGWRGSTRHWTRFETAYVLLSGLSTPLVLSVHTVVSFDFAVAVLPGWHTTIFPPYFVAGAIYCGFAMVLVLAIPIREMYGLQDLITKRHLVNAAKVMLGTGLIVAYGYGMEAFAAFYSGNKFESFMWRNRAIPEALGGGPYWWTYWALIFTNIIFPQLLWIRKVRYSSVMLFIISFDVLIGMWLERFVIVVTSLHRDFITSSWGYYKPTFFDWSTYIGTLGLFFTLFYLFMRFLPAISMFEVRMLLPESRETRRQPAPEAAGGD